MSPSLANKKELSSIKKGRLRILVVTGASGGHVFPAFAFLDTLKESGKEIEALLVLPKRSIINKTEKFAYRARYISISSVKLKFDFKNFLSLFSFFKGVIESIFILLEFRPGIVVGFGSIACVPLVLFAKIFGIKTLIHEQNVLPGRANRLLAKFSDRVAISFAETKDHFPYCQKKVVFTGNPIRNGLTIIDRNKALDFFRLSYDKFTILVFGGSSGSHRINACFVKAISKIPDKSRLQVIHLAGEKDYSLLKDSYKNLHVDSRVFVFLSLMQYAYSACDLVISRSGATTVAEILFFGLPAIIIPYPYAYKHQLENARVLEKRRAALIINDDVLGSDILSKAIVGLLSQPDRIKAMRLECESFFKDDANAAFLESVLSLS